MNEHTLLEDLNSLGIQSGVELNINGSFRGKPIDTFIEAREINIFNKVQPKKYKIVSFTGDIRPEFTEFWLTFEYGNKAKLECVRDIFQKRFEYKYLDFSSDGGFILTELKSFTKRWSKGIEEAADLAEILYFLRSLADKEQTKKRWTGINFSNPLSVFLSPRPIAINYIEK